MEKRPYLEVVNKLLVLKIQKLRIPVNKTLNKELKTNRLQQGTNLNTIRKNRSYNNFSTTQEKSRRKVTPFTTTKNGYNHYH